MGSQVQSFDAARQRESVTDQPFQIHFTAHHKSHRILLQLNRSTVRPQQRFLIYANRAGIESGVPVYRLREQQNPASRTYRIHRSPDQTITTDRQDGRICASSFGHLPHRNYQVGTRSINAVPQAVTCRYCKPLRIQIGSDYHGPICALTVYLDVFAGNSTRRFS